MILRGKCFIVELSKKNLRGMFVSKRKESQWFYCIILYIDMYTHNSSYYNEDKLSRNISIGNCNNT